MLGCMNMYVGIYKKKKKKEGGTKMEEGILKLREGKGVTGTLTSFIVFRVLYFTY